MITLLIILLILSIAIIAFAIKLIKIQIQKIKTYEEWIVEFKSDVSTTLENLRSIDKRGTFATSLNEKRLFESDDEVGTIFLEIKDIIEKLNQRTQ